METANLSDKFSWRRMADFGMMFKRSMCVYLLISAGISLACYLLLQLTIYLGGNEMGMYTMLSFIVALALYLSPLTFARRDNTLIALIPAKPVEKWLFFMLYSILASPLIIQGIWYGCEFLFRVFDIGQNINDIMFARINLEVGMIDMSERALIIGMSVIQTFSIMVTVLFIVLKSTRNRVVKGFIGLVCTLIGTGILSAIVGGLVAYFSISDDPDIMATPLVLIRNMMPAFGAIYGLLAVYSIILSWLLYRHILKGEVRV